MYSHSTYKIFEDEKLRILLMTLNLDDMCVFFAVARDSTLSAMGRHLKVTKPTVGRRPGQLKTDLEARLFGRLPEGFVPTQAGEELLPIA